MSSNDKHLDLVRQAQLGSKESMDELVDMVQPRVSAYINRLTLEHDLAQDLSQQTLLTMIESLKRLTFEYPEQFWAWLYRTAQGKVQQHYRNKSKEKSSLAVVHQERLLQTNSEDASDGLSETVRDELSSVISKAMARLKLKQRSVLALRCYEQMPYSQIAGIVGCSEVRARGLFFQAKLALKRQLVRSGLNKGMLLTALWLFGRMTSDSRAATETARVTLASTKVGPLGALVGSAGTKSGIAVVTILAASILIVGSVDITNNTSDSADLMAGMLPQRSEINSFHYVKQAWDKSGGPNPNLALGRSISKGAYEQWYYFPDGIDGPLFMMMQRWDPQQKTKLCGWLQNGSGNYYFHSGKETIYRYNYHLPMRYLSTRRLPSDPKEFTEFLDQIEGESIGVDYTRDSETGLLVGALDNRFYNARGFESSITYNILDEGSFDSFRYPWPEDASVIDERDKMHKRGWTCFRIYGRINEEQVQGLGQIPFIYDAYREHPPWLSLAIGDKLKFIDCPSGAYITAPDGKVIASFPAGSFFKGLARPWAGMHAVDIIRRDAAEKRIRFNIRNFDSDDEHYGKAEVKLFEQTNQGQIQIAYTVDIDQDIIEEIKFSADGDAQNKAQGVFGFTYLEDVDQLSHEFTEPAKIKVQRTKHRDSMGMLWLIELAQGTSGQ